MRKRNVFFLLGLMLILLLAAAPLIVALGAGAYAANHGCVLHEGFVNPCIVDGQDVGQTLYQLGMVGWFAIATLPLGLGAAGNRPAGRYRHRWTTLFWSFSVYAEDFINVLKWLHYIYIHI